MNKTSLRKLASCHSDLQLLAHAVDKVFPIQVICGERGEKDQEEAFRLGTSDVHYPESKHNVNISRGRFKSWAMDAVPDPDKNPATIDWENAKEFEKMCLVFEQKADELDIKIRLGRDFKNKKGKPMLDMPHVELI